MKTLGLYLRMPSLYSKLKYFKIIPHEFSTFVSVLGLNQLPFDPGNKTSLQYNNRAGSAENGDEASHKWQRTTLPAGRPGGTRFLFCPQ